MTTYIIIALAGALFGVIASYILFSAQRRRRALCWSIDSVSLIKGYSSLYEKLEIEYGNQKIENLTVSKIVFWNSGNETIDNSDIAIPPHIWTRLEDATILDVKVIASSALGNDFHAEVPENRQFIVLNFDYLDREQGAVVQVIHTGVSILPLVLDGEVKGVQKIEYKSKRLDFGSQIPRLFIYFSASVLSLFSGLSIYAYGSVAAALVSDASVWLLVIGLPLAVILVAYDIRQSMGTARIPRNLSIFEKDDLGIKRTG